MIDWVGMAAVVAGTWFLALGRPRAGFTSLLLGCLAWGSYAVTEGLTSLLAMNAVLGVGNLVGLYRASTIRSRTNSRRSADSVSRT